MNLFEFCQAAAKWNSLRYEQEIDLALLKSLLTEEFNEYKEAEEALEAIDATIDLAFVAAGAVWKSGYTLCEQSLNSIVLFNEEINVPFHSSVESAMRGIENLKGKFLLTGFMYQLIGACYVHVSQILNSEALAKRAFEAIVVSNNTKTAQIIALNEKYSAEGKGQSYIPPTETLQLIIAEAESRGQKLN